MISISGPGYPLGWCAPSAPSASVLGTAKGSIGVGEVGVNDLGDGVVGRGHRAVDGKSNEFQGDCGHSRSNAGVA